MMIYSLAPPCCEREQLRSTTHAGLRLPAIDQAGLNCDTNEIGGIRRSEFGLELGAIVRDRLVAYPDCIGDLSEISALRE